ncbi:MAG: DnaD domain protein [Lactobacillaceae bacterium]|jgi:replication initiation and membrane attachment protein|nr:DnaD domain protein [Lactobacillaceae bacterium]
MTFNSNQRYKIVMTEPLSNQNIQVLTQLYLPIIGQDAFSIYLNWTTIWPTRTALTSHIDLLDQLNMSNQRFIQARQRLEALGLVQTYQQQITLGTQWAYEIFLPVSAKQFFAEKLLVGLLTHFVGETEVARLQAFLVPEPPVIAGQNISQGFFDVIGDLDLTKAAQLTVAAPVVSPLMTSLGNSLQRLDLDLIADMLKSRRVTKLELQTHAQNLLLAKELYGLSDTDLVRVLQQHIKKDQTIDITAVERQLAAEYKASFQNGAPVEEPATPASNDQANPLIAAANAMPPLDFIGDIREQTNGMMTSAEIKTIKDLAKFGKLPSSVFNILLYELSVVEGRSNLSKALLEALYNDWSQAGIKTPAQAIEYLKKRATDQKSQPRYPKNNRQTMVLEKQPEQKPDIKPLSADEQTTFDTMMAEMIAKEQPKED